MLPCIQRRYQGLKSDLVAFFDVTQCLIQLERAFADLSLEFFPTVSLSRGVAVQGPVDRPQRRQLKGLGNEIAAPMRSESTAVLMQAP